MRPHRKGLVHIYTGNGKGKTTAAFGLAVRATGAGLRVAIHQFMKGRISSETDILRGLRSITLTQCGSRCFIRKKPHRKDIAHAARGFARATHDLLSGKFDLVILDEINGAVSLGLIPAADVISLIEQKPEKVELVLTGRNCPKRLYPYADYITEMRQIKHPYRQGIAARAGIEH